MSHQLPVYRVRAANTARDSENKMHDDRVAAEFGFRGGLVPGVTVYGYMTVPLIEFAPRWPERGSINVRFVAPFYDGDPVVVQTEVKDDSSIHVTARTEDGTLCAEGVASIESAGTPPEAYPKCMLPIERPIPSRESLVPGAPLGSIVEKLESADPARLLRFSNEILMRNFLLGPWIHAASEVANWSAAQPGEEISVLGKIHERFDRKGHEFVVADTMLVANGERLVQTVRHTAIYRPRN